MTRLRMLMASAALAATCSAGAVSQANAVTVANPSFENGLGGITTWSSCASVAHPNCQSVKSAVPSWQAFGAVRGDSGLFQSDGRSLALDDGPTAAYSSGGQIQQFVALSQLGTTYHLSVDVGYRTNKLDDSSVYLMVNGFKVLATTTATVVQNSGVYYTYTADFKAITNPTDPTWNKIWVILDDRADRSCTTKCVATGQGVWDNVVLTSSVPEPATWALMLTGFGAIGYAARRRAKAVAAA